MSTIQCVEACNTMQYDYLWRVVFRDGTSLKQFDDYGHEVNSKDFWDRIGDISQFFLEGNGKHFGVDLENGQFLINGFWLCPVGEENMDDQKNAVFEYTEAYHDLKEIECKRKLIFFRRNARQISMDGRASNMIETVFFMGWEGMAEGDVKFKRVLQIHPGTNLVFG